MAINMQNLIPNSARSPEELRRMTHNGGVKSGEIRRKKKSMAETINHLMSLPIQNDSIKDSLTKLGIEDNELNNQTAMIVAMYQQSLKGNVNAFNSLRDTSGNNYQDVKEEKSKESDDDSLIFIPAKDIGRAFSDINREIDDRKYNDIWFEGGRGSTKSSYWSEKLIEILENNPNMCAIAMRKVGNTMKDSIYSQIQWGIDKLSETYPKIKEHWVCKKSPLEIVNIKTGQIIYFRGVDDPGKIKSIKPPKDKYIGVEVYEEFDQMNGMAEVRKIDQSVKRGGDDIIVFRAYNTPKSNNHFVNREKIIPKQGRFIHKSSYLDVPKEWLGQPFIDDAEYLKEINLKIYENEYLGLTTGDGGNVFENVEIREITYEEINTFDYIYQGLDFGWFPDPLAWTKSYYNPAKRTLYIYDEYVVNKKSNQEVWDYLKEYKGVTENELIIADSAEPKSIGDFKAYGAMIKAAEKGPGSVDYSMKWLASLAKIVIDSKRCPTSADEFSTYEYEQDKDGEYISGYVDANNHCIDSVRYALNNIWRKKGK